MPEDGEIEPGWLEVDKILDVREEEVTEVVDEHPPPVIIGDIDDGEGDGDEDVIEEVEIAAGPESVALGPVQVVPVRFSEAGGSTGNLTVMKGEITSDGLNFINENGEEERRTVTAIFAGAERCRRVLERVWDDPFAVSFIEPVDCDTYDDYLDVVETPMCLRDIKEKIEAGGYSKYNQHTKFALDMRLIWRNCKLYNLYRSQIWYSAHALSMMFERLYQGWVTSFSDGTIPISDPTGMPWETACRSCQQEDDDDQMMLCDHCDAAYHIYCLDPPLEVVPEGNWNCTR